MDAKMVCYIFCGGQSTIFLGGGGSCPAPRYVAWCCMPIAKITMCGCEYLHIVLSAVWEQTFVTFCLSST